MDFLLILLVIGIGWYSLTLHNRLTTMEEQLHEVQGSVPTAAGWNELMWRIWRLENPAGAPSQHAENRPAPEVSPGLASRLETVGPEATRPETVEPEIKLQSLPARPSIADRVRGILGSQEWEMLVGGSFLNKVGAFVLVIGIALFLGYSIAHVTPADRAALANALSFALLGAGVRTERSGKYRVFARGLIGAGWAALYATAYAVYAIPAARIVPNPFAGSLILLLVALGMIGHSLRYRAQSVTALAYFAAFAAIAATPSSPFAVISLLPLAASLLFLAWRFEWHSMSLFGLAATYLTCISRGNSEAPLAATQSLFVSCWILFEAFDLLRVRRRLVNNGLDLISPLNTTCFLALSYLSWVAHAPHQLWLASAFGAVLFLANSLARAAVRPPVTFNNTDDLVARLRSGSYEGALLVSSILAGLAVFGHVPGVWASVWFATEAEIIYLAGLKFRSSFLRRLGARAFALSVLQTVCRVESHSGTFLLGHAFWNWTPALLFHAVLFILNRALRRTNVIMSWCAALMVVMVLAAELPADFVGTALIVLGLTLLETGLRTDASEFRAQAWACFAFGWTATFFPDLAALQNAWLPTAISLLALYVCALRTRRTRLPDPLWALSSAAALLALLLAQILVPAGYLAPAWCGIAVMVLEGGAWELPRDLRFSFGPLALIAATAVISGKPDQFTYVGTFVCAAMAAVRLTLWPPATAESWERTILRDATAALACAACFAALWLAAPSPFVTLLWAAAAVAACEAGMGLRLRSFRMISLAALLAVYLRVFALDLNSDAAGSVPFAIAAGYWIWRRTSKTEDFSRPQFWAAVLPVVAFIGHEAGVPNAAPWWVALACLLLWLGNRFQVPDARLQGSVIAGLAFSTAIAWDVNPPDLWIVGPAVAGLYLAQYLAEAQASVRFSCLATILLSLLLYFQAADGLLTISWGMQGLTLLGCGFVLRSRILRLQGLGLLFICVLKLFLYDFRNLETLYRILSFVALGLILLSVSWIYTRFREHIRRLL